MTGDTTIEIRGVQNSSVKENIKITFTAPGFRKASIKISVRTWPKNFEAAYAPNAQFPNCLYYNYKWESETGVLTDLDVTSIWMGELVSYQSSFKSPPYQKPADGWPGDPTCTGEFSAQLGSQRDIHKYPGFPNWETIVAGKANVVSAQQLFGFWDLVLDPPRGGPIPTNARPMKSAMHAVTAAPWPITRTIAKNSKGKWEYTIAKTVAGTKDSVSFLLFQ